MSETINMCNRIADNLERIIRHNQDLTKDDLETDLWSYIHYQLRCDY